MLAIPVLASAGSVGMAGVLHKELGFSRSPRHVLVFYGLVLLGTLGGTLVTFIGIDPVKLLTSSALINGLFAAPFLVLVMLASADPETMGDCANGHAARIHGGQPPSS